MPIKVSFAYLTTHQNNMLNSLNSGHPIQLNGIWFHWPNLLPQAYRSFAEVIFRNKSYAWCCVIWLQFYPIGLKIALLKSQPLRSDVSTPPGAWVVQHWSVCLLQYIGKRWKLFWHIGVLFSTLQPEFKTAMSLQLDGYLSLIQPLMCCNKSTHSQVEQ